MEHGGNKDSYDGILDKYPGFVATGFTIVLGVFFLYMVVSSAH